MTRLASLLLPSIKLMSSPATSVFQGLMPLLLTSASHKVRTKALTLGAILVLQH